METTQQTQETKAPPPRLQSDSIDKLAEALAKAQGEFTAATKEKTNPHFRSKYADLASIIGATRPALSRNGLCVTQQVSPNGHGVWVRTTLAHTSGQWIADQCWMPVAKMDAQGIGSAITYGKRYSLAALLCVAAEDDDDGEGAVGRQSAPLPTGRELLAQAAATARSVLGEEEPPPPSDADAPPDAEPVAGHRTGFLVPFGKSKGKDLADATHSDLTFLQRSVAESVADPAKARFRDKNAALLAAINAELERRGEG